MRNDLSVRTHAGVTILKFSRPESMNAMTPDMEGALRDAIEAASVDPDVKVILLTGEGRAFCAGADLKAVKAGDYYEKQGKLLARAEATEPPYIGRFSYFALCPKPIIAFLNGAAIGVGMTIALHCDIRLVNPDAKLSFAFPRLGLAAEEGVAFLLPRLIGASAAMELLLSGKRFTGRDAASYGLATLLDDPKPDEAAALARVGDMFDLCSPDAMRRIKAQIWESWLAEYETAIRTARKEVMESRNSADFAEAVAGFAEKRPPRFQGLGS
ncbi:enoyl-CoA hydratase [Pseudohalocynthiibacter aestuariivivens]|nr:enoyl-CoA hydratase-related protein [Pseudohalocynthiibacter aestuariivivens]QIE45964.1 enoyl-CoA hydratase [Pseudohalocynthiibacter aestuariivivens]